MDHRPVWYASYGSNVDARRFACYLGGGRPPGATRTYRGSRDTSDPLDTVPVTLPYQLYFAGDSSVWGGSPAFIDTQPAAGARTLGRAYLIEWDQFEDVVAQENGRRGAAIDVDDHLFVPGFCRRIGPGPYENLVCTGKTDGIPVVTFTAPWSMSDALLGCPSASYLAVMIAGLRDSHRLQDEELMSYLGAAPGCRRDVLGEALTLAAASETE